MNINLFPQIYISVITYCYIYKLSEPGFHVHNFHTMHLICGLMKLGLNLNQRLWVSVLVLYPKSRQVNIAGPQFPHLSIEEFGLDVL